MTIREAVVTFVGMEVDPKAIDLELVNSGLDGDLEYSLLYENQVARMAVNVLSYSLMTKRFSEGDLTIEFDTAGIQKRLLFLASKYGFLDFLTEQPKIRDRSNLW